MTPTPTNFPRSLKALVSIQKGIKGLWEKMMNVRARPVAQGRPVPVCYEHTPRSLVAWLQLKALICAGQREVVPGALASALGHPARPQATGPGWAPPYLLSHLLSCLCSGEISVLTVRIFCYGWLLTHGGGSWSFGLDSWMGPTLKDIHGLCLSGNAWKQRDRTLLSTVHYQ